MHLSFTGLHGKDDSIFLTPYYYYLVIGSMKDELGGKFTTKFVRLRAKTYSCLTADGKENKNGKDTKNWVIKRKLKFEKFKLILSNSTWV